nr:MAG TPA: hypothetical protein [Bacteriophage sp.]
MSCNSNVLIIFSILISPFLMFLLFLNFLIILYYISMK